MARYAVQPDSAGQPAPLVTFTLPVAEAVRRELLRKSRVVLGIPRGEDGRGELCARCPSLLGKDRQGRPLQGHGHAYFLPIDEDGDGRIDHIVVVAEQGFTVDEVRALDRLRLLPRGEGEPLRLLLVGLGGDRDFDAPLLAPAAQWVSATPFVVTRYPKRRGRKRDQPEDYSTPQDFVRLVLGQELDRLRRRRPELPALVGLEPLAGLGPNGTSRPIQFVRGRDKPGDDGPRRPSGAFRLEFAAPLTGPLCLGHSAHFGLGLFWPEGGVLNMQ